MEETSLKFARDFAELAAQLRAEHREQPTLDRIVTLAVQTIDSCNYCGITLRERNGELTAAATTGPVATEVAKLQHALGEGPCLEATWELDTVTVNDLQTETRWPNWAPAAAALGVRSVLSLRLEITGHPVTASLNLFASSPGAFDSTDLAMASIFARHAANALASARAEDNLRAAARSRQIIGVAQGILIQRFGLTLDQSFELLRRYSQTHNVKLRVLAEHLVEAGGIEPSVTLDPATTLEQVFGLNGDSRPLDRPGPVVAG
jgi:GAF domain-containing protein